MINANCRSDDGALSVDFDAEPYFLQASSDDIRDLVACDWGGDYPADNVALFFEGKPEHSELSVVVTRAVGFECRVNSADAMEWIKDNRPELLAEISVESVKPSI